MERDLLMHFVDTTMCGDTPAYTLLGKGIASLTENFNANTTSSHWICDREATERVNSYAPSFDVEREDCIDDDTRTWIKGIIKTLPIGEDAVTYVVRVDCTEEAVNGKYPAVRRKYAVSPVSTGGDAGADVVDAVHFGGSGDQEEGFFDIQQKTWSTSAS